MKEEYKYFSSCSRWLELWQHYYSGHFTATL